LIHTVQKRHAYRVLVGKLSGRNRLEDLCHDGRIILKWLLKEVGWEGVNRMRLRIGINSGFLQTSIKCGEFVD
jgi:hypothetical protein